MAEVELGVPSGQCLDRRIASGEELDREVAAWQRRRNAEASKVTWQFTTDDARVKLRRLYLQL